jgi:hypothetical protein
MSGSVGEGDLVTVYRSSHVNGGGGEFSNAVLGHIGRYRRFEAIEIVIFEHFDMAHVHRAQFQHAKARIGPADIAHQCQIRHDIKEMP